MNTRKLSMQAVVAVSLAASTVMAQPNSILWYNKPAKVAMNEALPIGNGRMGALVFGGIERERLVFNEDSLWTGDENPTGDYKTMGAYQMFGDIFLTLDGNTPGVSSPGVSSPSGHKAFYPNEEVIFSVDNRADTKWCVEHKGQPVVWQIAATANAPAATSYSFISCPDYPARDPKTWVFSGSLDGQIWTSLDKRENQPPMEKRGEPVVFTFQNQTAFRFYRLTVLQNHGAPHFQIAEINVPGALNTVQNTPGIYRRDLNISSAIATTEFIKDGVLHRREAFVSHPDQVLVLHWSANKMGAVSGSIELKGAHRETTQADGTTLSFNGALSNGMRYAAMARVIARGGTAQISDGKLQLKNCNEATLLLTCGTDYVFDYAKKYRGDDPQPRVARQLEAASKKSYDALRAAHQRDFQSYFNRVALDLGTSPAERVALPTDQRKVVYAEKGGDPDLEELMFQYGRYLMISSSRPGALPANLQGLWNDSNTPPWSSDYHANINVQMNYWTPEVTNLAEFHTPFFDLIRSQLEPWRKATAAAKEFATPGKPSRGFAIRTSHNIHGGLGWKWDKTANAWYCQHLWEHYAFGGDKKYLRDVAYPIIKETCEFWEDRLKTLPDGRLVVPMGWSPEHGPDEDGVSYNQQIVWDLFTNYIEASQALNIDAQYRAKIAAMRDKLVGPKIGSWGQLQEWMVDRDKPDDHHRHTSHLFAVFPGRQISVAKTPEFAAAAKKSLEARGETGDVREWSFAWRTALAARLRDAELAHRMFQQLLSARNTCPNLFGLHPPMQIDGNFGITAGVAEMLVQSHEGEIRLLPALPATWPNGSVSGLRARGGFTVDMAWQNGKLTGATIHNINGTTARVVYGEKAIDVKPKRGQSVKLNGDLRVQK